MSKPQEPPVGGVAEDVVVGIDIDSDSTREQGLPVIAVAEDVVVGIDIDTDSAREQE